MNHSKFSGFKAVAVFFVYDSVHQPFSLVLAG